ncbi:hypothetical protein BH10CHL1_BH10CHL1_13270 [soil metagenome]
MNRPEYKAGNLRKPHFILFVISLLCGIFLCGFGPPSLVDRTVLPTQHLTASEIREWSQRQALPTLTAKALLLYDVDADKTLFARNADQGLPPASLTKLMTALIVLETDDLTATVTIQGADLIGGSSMNLQAGETLTVDQLLWGLLTVSGNDAATALARHIGGSVEAFVQQMNQRATSLGLKQTHFVNPEGNDADNHVTSANDLLMIARKDWAFPLFQKIVSTTDITVAGHDLHNTNELLGKFPGANGIKTGTTDNAGECLIASIMHAGHQVLSIVLGSSDRYSDTMALDGVYQANYTWVAGDLNEFSVLNRVYGPDGSLWHLRATGVPPILLIRQGDDAILQTYRLLQLPPANQLWQSGMTVGVVEWRLGDQVITTQPLLLW